MKINPKNIHLFYRMDQEISSHLRQSFIDNELKKRIDEYTDYDKLKLYIGTWNLNAQKLKNDKDVSEFIKPGYDIYVIGFQEIVDLNNVGNLLIDHEESIIWENIINDYLGKKYIKISSVHMVGLSMCIYIKNTINKSAITNLKEQICGVGLMDFMGAGGNKGGVAIRFELYDSKLCFINTHLAAHKHNIKERNEQYHTIIDRLNFEVDNQVINILNHDIIFWFGDLNYRLNYDNLNDVYQLINQKLYKELLLKDQLLNEKDKNQIFNQFIEGIITFPPTYKFIANTNLYDNRPDKKLRMPAWCDRILWYKSKHIKQIQYNSIENLLISDHKPVYSTFNLDIKRSNIKKRKLILKDILRLLDINENEAIPKISINQPIINFNHIKYNEKITKILTINNNGSVLAGFYFDKRQPANIICQPWITISPLYGILSPNQSIDIEITICITKDYAYDLIRKKKQIEETLILNVENGGATFILIDGIYNESQYGVSLSYLMLKQQQQHNEQQLQNDQLSSIYIPNILYQLIDNIHNKIDINDILFDINELIAMEIQPQENHHHIDSEPHHHHSIYQLF